MTSASDLDALGFAIAPQVLDQAFCEALCTLLGDAEGAGTRGILRMPEVMQLAESLLADIVRPHLPAKPIPVRGIYFDKRPETNWLVVWHQDLTLALKERVEVPGFGPWSVKEGVPHVQPPVGCWSRCSASVFTWMMRMRLMARCASFPAPIDWAG